MNELKEMKINDASLKGENEMINEYGNSIKAKIDKVVQNEAGMIQSAANMIFKTLKTEGKFFVVGSGHSHMMAEEIYVRAGGFAAIHPILDPELMLHQHPLKSTMVERLPGYAELLLNQYGVGAKDVLMVVSNSGRNSFPVEMAMGAKGRNCKVIALTNVTHSTQVSSRHSNGKKLMDVADLVIDNAGDFGDAATFVPGLETPVGATSTILGAFIMQSLIMEVVQNYVKDGMEPPVFRSSNIDGADEENRRLMEIYCRM